MDAVEYLKTLNRMCQCECLKCEFGKARSGFETCPVWQRTHPEEAVAIMEQWAAEHPAKTRQSVFLEQYPEARLSEDGILVKYNPSSGYWMCDPRRGPLVVGNVYDNPMEGKQNE